MILTYYGHALFTIALSCGVIIAADPYQNLFQFLERNLEADICTISHRHFEHNSVGVFQKLPIIIDQPGVHSPAEGVRITGIPTFHDDAEGQKRGQNLVFLLEAEGLRIVHLGDLGHVLSSEQIQAIGKPDVLLLPVGGVYTIDPQAALTVMDSLSPRITVPMHYRTRACPDMPIAPLSDFLQLLSINPEPMPICRITREDISERPPIIVMITPEGL